MSVVEANDRAPPPGNEIPSKKKGPKKKKKHISKHVLKAKSEAKEKSPGDATTSATKKKKKAADVVKDPTEASEYLKSWQAKKGWKFNKNTQSWLLRHMYETDKVSKSTFTILLEYMKGLEGKDAKKRVLEEATTRAKRYRDYEKAKEQAEKEKKEDEESEKNTEENAANTEQKIDGEDNFGFELWKALDDHDKRKEYKRARRVLEVLAA